ncbi:MAG: hypothetical protein EHM42_02480, partial [Planctomycetaceae bacterium]
MPSQGHSHAPSARYNSARDRRRVIWAILSLAIVLVAFGEARKPSNWTWLAPNPRDAGPPASSAGSLLAEKEALGDDQVRIVAPRVRGGANAGRSIT